MKNKLTMPLILVLAAVFGAHAFAGIQLSVNIAPPPIVVFDQPACPGDGYIWTPGYYQYGDFGYYWVPGQWIVPPSVGLFWTPGYWGFGDVGRAACSGITRSFRTWTATMCTILTRTTRWFGLSRLQIMRSAVKVESRHNPRVAKWKQAAHRIKARRRYKSRTRKRRITAIWQLTEPHTSNQSNG